VKPERLTLPGQPKEAVKALRAASADKPVLVFKKSPTCPISRNAEGELKSWISSYDGAPMAYAIISVLSQRALARGLTKELGIQHESPQALLFQKGEVVWHDSHSQLTQEEFTRRIPDAAPPR